MNSYLFLILSACFWVNANADVPNISIEDLSPMQKKTLESVNRPSNKSFFTMHHYADYNFSDLLKAGSNKNHQIDKYLVKASKRKLCSTFSALNPRGEKILGHNIDWLPRGTLLVFIHNPGGISSVSNVSLENLGYVSKFPHLLTIKDRLKSYKVKVGAEIGGHVLVTCPPI